MTVHYSNFYLDFVFVVLVLEPKASWAQAMRPTAGSHPWLPAQYFLLNSPTACWLVWPGVCTPSLSVWKRLNVYLCVTLRYRSHFIFPFRLFVLFGFSLLRIINLRHSPSLLSFISQPWSQAPSLRDIRTGSQGGALEAES